MAAVIREEQVDVSRAYQRMRKWRGQPGIRHDGTPVSMPWQWFLPWPSQKETNDEDLHRDSGIRDTRMALGWLLGSSALGSDRLPLEDFAGAQR